MSGPSVGAAVSIGIAAASLELDDVAVLAHRVEQAGFTALWVNDTPDADALAVLASAAAATARLKLAVGAIPVDRRPAPAILADIAQLDLPTDRLTIGIGAGRMRRGALQAVSTAAAQLRAALPSRVVVGALGPRMRRLGAMDADGVLLSWLTPEIAAAQARSAHDQRAGAHAALYVRAAVDDDARGRLVDEAAKYSRVPAYAANFGALGITAQDTVIRPERAADRLAAYRATVDELVLRAVPADDGLDAHLAFVNEVRDLV
ncbi:TIGR03620 family F420-dependent LLM class oxidoreductase [Microbacterium awajiense]|uniref:TIGR03620 family F420-dependent LLM class oxidoreductase n=1 Tax=Microbacterium awajiense TaxID=415214 RepID=A0ABP7ACZ1_9MICO